MRSSWSTNWSTESCLSWSPRSQTGNGDPRVASRMACPTSSLLDVHLSRLRKVEVFGTCVTVVDNDLYFTPDTVTPKPVLAAVIYDLASDFPRDDCSFEDFLQVDNVLYGCTNFVFLSFDTWIFRRRASVSSWPLRAPLKTSTTLLTTLLISPSLNGARLAGS